MSALAVAQVADLSALASWSVQCAPTDEAGNRCTTLDWAGKHTFQCTALVEDGASFTDGKPRCQPNSADLIYAGEEYQLDLDLWIPPFGLPKAWTDTSKWIEYLQVAYGAPFAGSPPLRLMTIDGTHLGFREGDGAFSWQTSNGMVWRGRWWHFTVKWRQSATDGWYQLEGYRDDVPANNAVLVAQKSYNTIQACNNAGANQVKLDVYMSNPAPAQTAGAYFANVTLRRTA